MTTPTTPTTMVARSPQDLLAVVPIVLGFVPRDSVVMLTFGAPRAFHARIDLPPPEDVTEAVELLLEPARRHRVRRVVFVLYTDDTDDTDDAGHADHVCRALVSAFDEAGIDTVEALRAERGRWFPLLPGRPPAPGGVPYDVSAHPFAAQAVLDGRVTHRSRDELAASLARIPEQAAAVAAAARSVPRRAAAEAAWVRDTVARHVPAGTLVTDHEAARLLGALRDLGLRDVAWSLVDRGCAQDHVAFWTDLVRRSPVDLVPAPAALLGFAAWLAGHGALAWCAVDACLEVDPDYGLADILATLLVNAVPPDEWDHDAVRADVLDNPA